MDTNLKKSKKTRAFIYQLITVAAFFTMVASSLLGREALLNLYKIGPGALTGDIYYLTDFREYISELYTLGMLGHAGIGDDNGYPLTGSGTETVSGKARAAFLSGLQKGDSDILYHVTKNNRATTKGTFSYPLFSEYDKHLILPDDVILCCYWDGDSEKLHFFSEGKYATSHTPENYYTHQYKPSKEATNDVQLLLAIKDTDAYTSEYFIGLDRTAKSYQATSIIVLISGALFFIFGGVCLFTQKARRQAFQDCARITLPIWLELKLLLLGALLTICYSFNLWYFNGSLSARLNATDYTWMYVPTAIILYLFLQDLRHNKGRLFKRSLIYTLFCWGIDYFKSIAWQRKAAKMYLLYVASGILFIASGCILWYFLSCRKLYFPVSANILYIFVGAQIVVGILIILLSFRLKSFVSDTIAITNKLADISTGSPGSKPILSEQSLLEKAATDLYNVEHGIESAVEQNMRANRMRVELLTNVSHDLKTPLTSIINYADLLCEEKLPHPADEYAVALRAKAYRLKGMVQDVFELSKATSGNLPMEMVHLDLAKLVRQTLADMDEQIQQSSLTFKLNIITEPLMIEADGDKLYRIFQNLIINALQYSLENSRVYVRLDKRDGQAIAWIKNISKLEMNFEPEEIMERFVRADASRTTEGSGLGLSIVQSFTEACGGSFSIELNADLFTACVSFPLVEAPALPDTQESIEENIEK